MNILVSNDDGIRANGIKVLTKALSKENDVYLIAPDRERSAVGHSITLHTPLRVEEIEPKYGAKRCWMTTGTPGDCIKIGINSILSNSELPDMVIAGINHGPNLGRDILYSGTVSCAIEGALIGIPSIAVSLASMKFEYDDFKFAADFIEKFIKNLEDYKIPPKTVLNINVPSVEKEDISGVSVTEIGNRIFSDNYERRIDPRGKVYYWMAGELINEPEDAKTDIAAIRNNKISITPITYDMTRKSFMTELENQLKKTNLNKNFLEN